MDKIKILYAMGGNMHRAGAETMIMNYIRELVKYNEFEISVLVHGFDKGDYDDELKQLGVSIYPVSVRSKNPLGYAGQVSKVFSDNKFDIVHCNMDASSGEFLKTAKKYKVPVRIAHSHTTSFQAQDILRKLVAAHSKKLVNKVATDRFACSKMAGDWLFENKDYIVVNNAVDLDLFKRNNETRKKYRDEFGINDHTMVIGHIGRFSFEKNHNGLLNIFKQYHMHNSDSVLLCLGSGKLFDDATHQADALGIKDSVRFLGVRSDINGLLQAMDVFVLPSLFEGLPVVGIEAQAAGLPCIFSTAVTNEVCILPTSKRLELEKIDEWVSAIDSVNVGTTIDSYKYMTDAGYSVKCEAEKLRNYYLNAVSR